MDRRLFAQSLVGAAGALAFGARAVERPVDAYFSAFEARRADTPWTLGYAGLQADAEPMPLTLRGRLPAALQGAFYRCGAARHALGGLRYHHWFDGDGMLQKYSLGAAGIVHQGRFVRTEKFVADSAAGRPVRVAFATQPPGAEKLSSPDSINVANTSVLAHGGELMALWEGGSAMRMDPATLETRGPKVWSADYAGMPFSAHPKIEPDGSLWNFGVSSLQGLLSIYRVGSDGRLLKATTFKVPDLPMVHDFAVTERHLVFLLPPLVLDAQRLQAGATFLDSHVWRPELGMRVLLVEKDDFEARRWLDLPAGFVFHLGNAWEERGSGVIRLDFIRSPDARGATQSLQALMQGRYEAPDSTAVALVELDPKRGRARQTLLPHWAEFPRVDPRVVGRRYGQLFTAARIDARERPGYDAVMRLDLASGVLDRFRYGADVMVEEHIFVPRPGGSGREGAGWLVGTALDLKQQAMLFSVFDAQRLAQGPIAQGTLPRVMPLGLHAAFVPT